jgi:hypothetical protein
MLAVAVCAVLGGARSFAAIAQWAADLDVADRTRLGLTRSAAPDEATFRRVLAGLDAAVVDGLLGAFMWTATQVVAGPAGGRRVIAIDGKTVRGARTAERAAPHLIAALDHATGAVLGQLAVAARSNEIPAVRTLLASFDPAALRGSVITVDAMHTQTDTAMAIIGAGADYVFTVKANQPTLHAKLKALPWHDVPARTSTQTGTDDVRPARSRRSRRPPGSASPAPSRSPRSAGPSPAAGRRPSRSSTSSPPPTTSRHPQQ